MSIKIENTEVFGWKSAIRGARNPMNSWEKSDSIWITENGDFYDINGNSGPYYNPEEGCDEDHFDPCYAGMIIGSNDYKLLMNLCKGGTEESKWRRMVHVQMDITAPLYWWKEFETYKVGTVSNSCSTMHKIQAKEFTLDDFSHEHLIDYELYSETETEVLLDGLFSVNSGLQALLKVIDALNFHREKFLETKDKKYWWQIIQLLPTSYNQKRTIDLNYEVLAAQYRQRKDHKLTEWLDYCSFIKSLSYSEFITIEK